MRQKGKHRKPPMLLRALDRLLESLGAQELDDTEPARDCITGM